MLKPRDVGAEHVVTEHPFHATAKHWALIDGWAIHDLAWSADRPSKRSVPVGMEIVLDPLVVRFFD